MIDIYINNAAINFCSHTSISFWNPRVSKSSVTALKTFTDMWIIKTQEDWQVFSNIAGRLKK